MSNQKPVWIALSYELPASPSRLRVYVWRRLRTLGAQTLRPGLAVLPNSKENAQSFRTLSAKIHELGGEALRMEMNLLDEAETVALKGRFEQADAAALREVLADCADLLAQRDAAETETARLSYERLLQKKLQGYHRVSPLLAGQLDELERAVGELFGTLRNLPSEFAALLHRHEEL